MHHDNGRIIIVVIILFKTSFSAPESMHTMRCSPCTTLQRRDVCPVVKLAFPTFSGSRPAYK